MKKIVLGVAPTRRDYFTNDTVMKNRDHIYQAIEALSKEFQFELVDIKGLSDDDTMADIGCADRVAKRFQEKGVNALFLPHVNFGQEETVVRLARHLGVPTLVWGGRDEAPDGFNWRETDTQCGLFASGKALYRAGVPFTYLENCRLSDPAFRKGFVEFLSTASIVAALKGLRIAQISVRPQPFLSVMVNESELYERFGIEVIPVPATQIIASALKLSESKQAEQVLDGYRSAGVELNRMDATSLHRIAGLELAIRGFAEEKGCDAAVSECWNIYGDGLGIRPCAVFGNLTDGGLPVACENDVHGAISMIIAQAANRWQEPIFLADLTQRHPQNDNAELLWHCGPFPKGLRKLNSHAFLSESMGQWQLRDSNELTLLRFDGCRGQYSLLAGISKTVDGPLTNGNYVWVEVDDWARWEKKLVTGPYIHHTACVYGNYVESVMEACKYLPGVMPDRP